MLLRGYTKQNRILAATTSSFNKLNNKVEVRKVIFLLSLNLFFLKKLIFFFVLESSCQL